MPRKDKYTVKQVADALIDSAGLTYVASRKLGCSWTTVKRMIDKHPTLREVVEEQLNRVDELAIRKIVEAIKDGDMQTSRWWLERRRRSQFGINVDITSQGQKISNVTIVEVVKYAKDQNDKD